jgi:hypothetical protein
MYFHKEGRNPLDVSGKNVTWATNTTTRKKSEKTGMASQREG